jgi:hypothetical protein
MAISSTKAKKTPGATAKPRGRAARILALRRRAAGRSRWHKIHLAEMARQHFIIFTLSIGLLISVGGFLFLLADNLIPPPGTDIDIDAYERVAAANRPPAVKGPDQVGVGSWYALGLRSPDALTCASTKFPRGTYLKVTDLRNHAEVVCLVNDYGPTAGTHRVIDLSRGSYRALEGLGSGTMPVEIRVAPHP